MAVPQRYLWVTSRDRPKLMALPPGPKTCVFDKAICFYAGHKLVRLSGEVEEQSKALQASHEQGAQLESEIDRRNQELQAAKQQVKAECTWCLSGVVVYIVSACLMMHRTRKLQDQTARGS